MKNNIIIILIIALIFLLYNFYDLTGDVKKNQVILYEKIATLNHKLIYAIENQDKEMLSFVNSNIDLFKYILKPSTSEETYKYLSLLKELTLKYSLEELKNMKIQDRLLEFQIDYIEVAGYNSKFVINENIIELNKYLEIILK